MHIIYLFLYGVLLPISWCCLRVAHRHRQKIIFKTKKSHQTNSLRMPRLRVCEKKKIYKGYLEK